MDRLIFDGAIGDTIGSIPLVEIFHNMSGKKIDVYTQYPELFEYNPFVSSTNKMTNQMIPTVDPCRVYKCNALEHYMNQLKLQYDPNRVIPKIYVSEEESINAKNELKNFYGFKKVAVCLNTAADSKNLRYDVVKSLIMKIKSENIKTILFGAHGVEDPENIFDKIVAGQSGIGLRRPISLMNECDLYIGIDTGLYHMAAALGKPQFVFFRNNESKINCYNNTYYVDSDLNCSNQCMQPYTVGCYSHIRCMDTFDMDKCLETIKKLL